MSSEVSKTRSLRSWVRRQGGTTFRGLMVVLVPTVLIARTLKHATAAAKHAMQNVAPELKVLLGIDLGIMLLLAVVGACWFLGWLMSRTELGQQIVEWEKSQFQRRSPFAKKRRAMKQAKEKTTPPGDIPALAEIGGAWQPAVIVTPASEGRTTVYLPDVPNVTAGRLACLPTDRVVRLEVSLETFRDQLEQSGRGSEGWQAALAAASSPPA